MKMILCISILLFICVTSIGVYAQTPPEPPGNHGSNNNQGPGGNASLVSGTVFLLGLGLVYGAKKLYEKGK